MRKATVTTLTVAILLWSAAGCALTERAGSGGQVSARATATAFVQQPEPNKTPAEQATVTATTIPPDYSGAVSIALADTITVNGQGASAQGNTVTITDGGAYRLSGTLADGQIIVKTESKEPVTLVLDGVDITCSTNAPIYIMKAEGVLIALADGSTNHITDGASYNIADPEANEPNAAIFSKDDLTIEGPGTLTVDAHYKHAINSKDKLSITGGQITVNAAAEGLRGRDSITIAGGQITVNATEDGLKSDNDEDPEKGLVTVTGGTLKITSGQDGIDAQTKVLIQAGEIAIAAGGGSSQGTKQGGEGGNWGGPQSPNAQVPGQGGDPQQATQATDDTISTKGIKGLVEVAIEGGNININAADDGLHSNGQVTVTGGDIAIASGDDGIHADAAITIRGGRIDITQSYEGIESKVITIRDGNIHVVSSDDGINVASASDSAGPMDRQERPGGNQPSDQRLEINGGYIAVDATGDGVDINGAASMTAGVLIVNGPTSDGNGALDYDGGFDMSGGLLVAAGSAGMAQAPDESSTQHALIINLNSPLAAKTLFHIAGTDGQEILTFAPSRQYQSVVLCSPELKNGATYIAYSGGRSTGTVTDGLYSGGEYTGGSEVARFTVSSIVTGVGSVRGRFGGGGRR